MASSTSPTPSYHLCPDFSIAPPPDGHLTLGSILKSLDHDGVSHPLNLNSTIDISEENIFPRSGPDSKTGFTRTLKELRATQASIWAKIFSNPGASFSFLRNRTDDETLEVEDLQTRYFSPDHYYMTQSLKNKNVEGFIYVTEKKFPVYMVTGLKVAYGAKLRKAKGKKTSLSGQVTVADAQGAGSGGVTGSFANENFSSVAFNGSAPFVLGIRVRKIWWEDGVTKTSDNVAGQTLDEEDGGGNVNLAEDAKFNDDFLFDDGTSEPNAEIFVNKDESLGIESSNWVLGYQA
ncbi:major facilitator superfamily transporter [Fusarium sp. NRRL 52700]|nr:major facilitator superfamily transporter [Fusarium sp. NRRL 52700]